MCKHFPVGIHRFLDCFLDRINSIHCPGAGRRFEGLNSIFEGLLFKEGWIQKFPWDLTPKMKTLAGFGPIKLSVTS